MRYVLLLLVACGGSPTAPFLGRWRGTQSTTLTPNIGGTPRTVGGMTVDVTFAENLATGDVDFGDCQSGTPNGDKLNVRMSKAPCVVPAGDCSLALTTTTGTVTARGQSMTMDYGGSYRLTCPTMGDEAGTFAVHGNLTKT